MHLQQTSWQVLTAMNENILSFLIAILIAQVRFVSYPSLDKQILEVYSMLWKQQFQ